MKLYMKKIDPSALVAFAPLAPLFSMAVDPVYGQAEHGENLFGPIYHPEAQIWGHRDIVKITALASCRLNRAHGWTLVVKDCLRTVEAQWRIGDAPISRANPQWFVEPRLMSPPGMGGHPRGMAVDIVPLGVDMGTVFDCLTAEASRSFSDLPPGILENRRILEEAMMTAAKDLGLPLHPLSNEWWDFRFPAGYYNQFAPLSDSDLLPHQKMTEKPEKIALEPDRGVIEALRGFVV